MTRINLLLIIVLICLMFGIRYRMDQTLVNPFFPLKEIKLPLEKYFVLDSVGIISGLRRLVSNIAWIQLLQYYGEDPQEDEPNNYSDTNREYYRHKQYMLRIQPGEYRELLQYCQRIVRLDHLFSYIYFYGSGVLAWNVERPDEALKLIDEGLRYLEFQKNNPESDYWTLVLYQSAIYYKIGEKYKEMVVELEKIVSRGNAPNLVKVILANLYKKFGEYDKALNLWYHILSTGDPEYTERAMYQIIELKKLKYKVRNL